MDRITQHQQNAIKAKLNMLLGAEEYDRLFMRVQLTTLRWGILTLQVKGEHVEEIENRYRLHIAFVAESVLQRAVKVLIVLSEEVPGSIAGTSRGTQSGTDEARATFAASGRTPDQDGRYC